MMRSCGEKQGNSRNRIIVCRFSMRVEFICTLAFLSCGVAFAQATIPAGTILPLALDSSISTNRLKPGQTITATVMQDVPLVPLRIPARSKVIGAVLEAVPASKGCYPITPTDEISDS